VVGNLVGIYRSPSAIIINAILVVFSILSKNYKSYEEIDLIIRFSLNNRVIYSIIRIIYHNWEACWWVGRLVVGNWIGIYRHHQVPPSSTQFWYFLVTLSKNYKSNKEIDLIFGFSLKNWIIYSIPRIFPYNWGDEFDLKMEIPVLIFPENC
jgi:hypothetical protein